MKKLLSLLLAAALTLGLMPASFAASPVKVRLDSLEQAPRFDGWGTSLCWWAEVLGGEDEVDRLKISRSLFDADEGLGLNIVRYNIGAGDDPEHTHLNNGRGMPVWTDENGNFNPNADPNQISFLKDAVSMGADIVEVFSNSPPYYMTVSGCSSGGKDPNENNISPDKFDDFAEYLATVTEYINNDLGIKVNSLEPMNEANTDFWGYEGSQEGCHIDAEDHSALIIAADKALKAHGLNDVTVAASDENNMDVMAGYLDKYTPEALALMPRLNVHSYGGGYGGNTAKAKELGKELYMSEVDGDGSIGYDSGSMGPALWFGKKIADDMNNLRPNAWICWQVADFHWQGKTPDNGYWNLSGFDPETGEVLKYKKYYAFAHFTKFIRPGWSFLNSGNANVFAARDEKTGEAAAVIINAGKRDEVYELDLSALGGVGDTVMVYRTDAERDLALLENAAELNGKTVSLSIPKSTITTVVVKNGATSSGESVRLTASAVSGFPGDRLSLNAETNGAEPTLTAENAVLSGTELTLADAREAAVTASLPGGISSSLDIDIIHSGDAVRLVNVGSGLALQERGGYVQEGDNDSAGQYWVVNRIGDIASFTNLRSKALLRDDGGSEWRITPGDGGWGLVNTKTGKGLDVYGHATHEGATVGTYEYGGGANQLWNFSHGALVPTIDALSDGEVEVRVLPTATEGTAPYGGSEEVSYEKVFDGDLETHHDAWDGENSYISATMPEGVKVNKVRFAPRIGFLTRMYGGGFYGVKDGAETLLYTVPETIRNGWNEFYFDSAEGYDKIIYRTPPGGLCNIAELEFYTAPAEAVLRYAANQGADGEGNASVVFADIKNHGPAAELKALVLCRDGGELKAVDIQSLPLGEFERRSAAVAIPGGFESAEIYILLGGKTVTSGYIYLKERN